MPKKGSAKPSASAAANAGGKPRGKKGIVGSKSDPFDDDDMTLSSTLGGGDGSVNEMDDTFGGGGDGLNLTMGDFTDPYGGFSLGAMPMDPLGNMNASSDPFVMTLMPDPMLSTPNPDLSLQATSSPLPSPPSAVTLPLPITHPSPASSATHSKSKSKTTSASGTGTSGSSNHKAKSSSAKKDSSAARSQLPSLSTTPFALGPSSTPMFSRLTHAVTANQLTGLARSLGNLSAEDLCSLASELGEMAREAKTRAFRLESELRKIGGTADEFLANQLPTSTVVLNDIPDANTLGSELSALLASALDQGSSDMDHPTLAGKRKRASGKVGDESFADDDPNSPHRKGQTKNKKKGAGGGKKGSGAGGNDSDDGGGWYEEEDEFSDPEMAARPKKKKGAALTEKEKQRQFLLFWNDVDEHFAFPNREQTDTVKPKDASELYDAFHGPPSSTSFGNKVNHSNDDSFKIPPMGENWKEVLERQREEEREKALKEKNALAAASQDSSAGFGIFMGVQGLDDDAKLSSVTPTAGGVTDPTGSAKKKKPSSSTTGAAAGAAGAASASAAANKAKKGKKTLSSALLAMGLDDAKTKKNLLETDKLLGGNKDFFQPTAQTMSMRLLSMLIEQPGETPRSGPWTPHSSGKDKKPATAAANAHRKKASEYSLDKRIEMEFKYLGLLGGTPEYSYTRELADRADDELCATLRGTQQELSSALEDLNKPKKKIYPTVSKLTDHTQKLAQLLEAEQTLIRVYQTRLLAGQTGTGKKKQAQQMAMTAQNSKENENAILHALHEYESTVSHTGSRRAITGFIPDPVDLGGIPRWRLNEYQPTRTYAKVFSEGLEVPAPRDAAGKKNFKHFIHPQHPHNPNYEAPPPPPPPPAPPAVAAMPNLPPPAMTPHQQGRHHQHLQQQQQPHGPGQQQPHNQPSYHHQQQHQQQHGGSPFQQGIVVQKTAQGLYSPSMGGQAGTSNRRISSNIGGAMPSSGAYTSPITAASPASTPSSQQYHQNYPSTSGMGHPSPHHGQNQQQYSQMQSPSSHSSGQHYSSHHGNPPPASSSGSAMKYHSSSTSSGGMNPPSTAPPFNQNYPPHASSSRSSNGPYKSSSGYAAQNVPYQQQSTNQMPPGNPSMSRSSSSRGGSQYNQQQPYQNDPFNTMGIGSLPPTGSIGNIGSLNTNMNSYGMGGGDLMSEYGTGLTPPSSPGGHRSSMQQVGNVGNIGNMRMSGNAAANSIGTLPPPDNDMGNFGLPSTDLFGIDDF